MRNVEAGHELSAASAHPEGGAAAPWIWWLSVEANEVSRASMRVRLTVRTIASRSLHIARPMVSSGKSLSSTPKGPQFDSDLVETEEAYGRECRHYGRPQAELRREDKGSVNTKKIWKILSSWQ